MLHNFFESNYRVIYVLIFLFFILSVIQVLSNNNILNFSIGFAYILYDSFLICYVFRLFKKYQSINIQNPNSNIIQLGIVISVKNDEQGIINTIHSIFSQSLLPEYLVVINDGSSDNTLKALKFFFKIESAQILNSHSLNCNGIKVELIDKVNTGKADSLNQGILFLKDKEISHIVTLDADTVLENDALKNSADYLKNHINVAVAGGILIPDTGCKYNSGFVEKFLNLFQKHEYLRSFISRIAFSSNNQLLLMSGAFSIFEKQSLLNVGLFNKQSLVEDYEIMHRYHKYSGIHDKNWQFNIIPSAVAFTRCPQKMSVFLKQRQRWFAGFLETHFSFLKMVGNPLYKQTGTQMLVIKSIDTVIPIFALFSFLIFFYSVYNNQNWYLFLMFVFLKIIFDFVFHCIFLSWHQRLINNKTTKLLLFKAFIVSVFEPFSFQILRQIGAWLGWKKYLTKNKSW